MKFHSEEFREEKREPRKAPNRYLGPLEMAILCSIFYGQKQIDGEGIREHVEKCTQKEIKGGALGETLRRLVRRGDAHRQLSNAKFRYLYSITLQGHMRLRSSAHFYIRVLKMFNAAKKEGSL